MKHRLPILVAFVSGGIMVLAFFGRGTSVDAVSDEALRGQTIVGGLALLLGVFSIVQVHWARIASGHADRVYSAVLLVCLAAMAGFGVFAGVQAGGVYDWLFQKIQSPMMATMFSMLAFFIASAAYRAFRARTMPSAILLVTALVVMLGRIPIGQYIYHALPDWTNWIMMVPSVSVQRGIIIGAALGAASMSLRILLGIERTYLGRG